MTSTMTWANLGCLLFVDSLPFIDRLFIASSGAKAGGFPSGYPSDYPSGFQSAKSATTIAAIIECLS